MNSQKDSKANEEERPESLRLTRREFGQAAVAAGVAVTAALIPESAEGACFATTGQPLLKIGEIAKAAGGDAVRGVIQVINEKRGLPFSAGNCTTEVPMRAMKALDSNGNQVWPPPADVSAPRPGPTIRARVGDRVELTFLNNIDESQFASSIDAQANSPSQGCDTHFTGNPPTKTVPFSDAFPNCFHGSNAANLHFHGTHVTPEGFGDNVLVQIQPDPTLTLKDVKASFDKIFAYCRTHEGHRMDWRSSVPPEWQKNQLERLGNYQRNSSFDGKRLRALGIDLVKGDTEAIAAGDWPPYQIGAYPYCFTVTPYTGGGKGAAAGQAPGTHWYHAHKHGSTTMHVLHGLAGAFIIEGQYDDDLRKFYSQGIAEQVLMIQSWGVLPKLYAGSNATQPILVNGQLSPQIALKQGEVQLWRIVNATMGQQQTLDFSAAGCPVAVRQIAQDGVQFSAANYDRAAKTNTFVLAPGNRIDLLVKGVAPTSQPWQLISSNAVMMSVAVAGSMSPAMNFPPGGKQYPITFPEYLRDITSAEILGTRRLVFGSNPPGPGGQPKFMINNQQFSQGVISQSMLLNDVQEWVLENTTTNAAHPFHIHVNPFQVVQVFAPALQNPDGTYVVPDPPATLEPEDFARYWAPCTTNLPAPYVWWDVFAIPVARIVKVGDTQVTIPGRVRIRHRFLDFTGDFVLHCHILGHEDRGMMQLIQVIDNKTNVRHH